MKISATLFFLLSLVLSLTHCKKEPTPPVVTTANVTDITQTTAKAGGNGTCDGVFTSKMGGLNLNTTY